MAGEFSTLDKALVLRAARHLVDEAATVESSHAPWTGTEGLAEKRRHDRFLRDARDLRALVKRLGRGATVPQP